MKLRSLRSARVNGRRVLVRVEFNVARDHRGRIVDDSRIRAVLPTIRWLRNHGAKVILLTHLGRPNGKRVMRYSTKPLVAPLRRLLGAPIQFSSQVVGRNVERRIARLQPGQVLLLENVRFEPGEEANRVGFSKALARLADGYVLESFGTAHREHASIVGLPRLLPSWAGFRLVEEVSMLSRVLHHPKRPLVVALGGAKVSTKLDLMIRLLPKVDALLLGGALANTMLQAKGIAIGRSVSEPSMVRRLRQFPLTSRKLHIPVDVIVHTRGAKTMPRAVANVQSDEAIYDIGADTVDLFSRVIRSGRTIVWNGPMGYYEKHPYYRGTRRIARAVAAARAFTIVGGGETVDALRSQRLEGKVDFLSTGGGAMLAFLEGKVLPGIRALQEARP